MKISPEKLKKICQSQGLTIHQLLRNAGVSRNAYYSLARKVSVLPKSLKAISEYLGVPPTAFFETEDEEMFKARSLQRQADNIAARHKRDDSDNIRHTLLLLQEQPVERLRRALRRGRQFNLQR